MGSGMPGLPSEGRRAVDNFDFGVANGGSKDWSWGPQVQSGTCLEGGGGASDVT